MEMSARAHRILAVVVAACFMLPGVSPATTQADPFWDSFDTYTTGEPPVPPWQELYDGPGGSPVYTRDQAETLGVTIQIDEAVSLSGKSVHFEDNASNVRSRLWRTTTPAPHVVLECYMRSDNRDYEGTFVHLLGDAGSGYAINFGAAAGGGHADHIGIFGPAGWVKPDLLEYEVGKWYYVQRELNCTSDVGLFYVEELYDYVKDEHTQKGDPANKSASFPLGSYAANTSISEVWLHTSGSQGADCYIDELSFHVVPEPISMAFMGSAFVGVVGWRLRRRRRGAGR